MDLWALSDLATPWCIHVVATLRIAQHIETGAGDIAELAERAGADRESLYRVMRHLTGRGVFEEHSPGCFALNDVSRGLLDEGLMLGLDLDGFGGRMAQAWGTLLSAVRAGKPAYHEAFGRDFWDDLEANPATASVFDELMGVAGHGTPDPEVLVNAAGWKDVRTVVDVGGGTGSLLAEILRAHRGVHGVLVDLPRVVAKSADVFAAAGVADRVVTSGQSFFDPLPPGADLYVTKNVLSDWPDPEALEILKRCAEAARPSGRVVLVGATAPGEEASPELLMMVLVGGKARTHEELTGLAHAAGLEVQAVGRQPTGRVLVEFVPIETVAD